MINVVSITEFQLTNTYAVEKKKQNSSSKGETVTVFTFTVKSVKSITQKKKMIILFKKKKKKT